MRQLRAKIEGKELISFCIITMILLFVMAFSLDTPADIGKGMITIILSRDTLITDYFELASYGAAFFNAAAFKKHFSPGRSFPRPPRRFRFSTGQKYVSHPVGEMRGFRD